MSFVNFPILLVIQEVFNDEKIRGVKGIVH